MLSSQQEDDLEKEAVEDNDIRESKQKFTFYLLSHFILFVHTTINTIYFSITVKPWFCIISFIDFWGVVFIVLFLDLQEQKLSDCFPSFKKWTTWRRS